MKVNHCYKGYSSIAWTNSFIIRPSFIVCILNVGDVDEWLSIWVHQTPYGLYISKVFTGIDGGVVAI